MNLRRVLGGDAKYTLKDNHLTRPGRSQDGRTVLTVLTVGKTVFQDGFQDGFILSEEVSACATGWPATLEARSARTCAVTNHEGGGGPKRLAPSLSDR